MVLGNRTGGASGGVERSSVVSSRAPDAQRPAVVWQRPGVCPPRGRGPGQLDGEPILGPGPTTSRNGKLINRLSRVQICLTIFHGVIEGVAVGNIYEYAATAKRRRAAIFSRFR